MVRCVNCVIPSTYPGIQFDDAGTCDFCREPPAETKLRDTGELLHAIARRRSADSKYDCMIALSGGRDSTFVLHYAVRILGLKVLAYTVDHAFLPPHTVQNIQNTVRILGVDHVMERHTYLQKAVGPMLSAWLRNPSGKTVSLLCLGCRQAMHKGIAGAARRNGIRTVLVGSGEAGTSEYFATRFFSRLPSGWRRQVQVVTGFGRELLRNPAFLMRPTLIGWMVREYLAVASKRFQKHVQDDVQTPSLFEFVRWDEDLITSTIQREYGWVGAPDTEATWRSDCKLAILKNQLMLLTEGFNINDAAVGELVRRQKLSRVEGLERIARENRVSEKAVRKMLDDLGVSVPSRLVDTLLSKALPADKLVSGATT